MSRSIWIYALWFLVGAVLTAAPFFVSAHFAHADELARGEPTMGPGITTFMGLLAAPVGGGVAVLIAALIRRRRQRISN